MAAYRPDVTRISRYEGDVSELPGKTDIFDFQKHAGANTPPRQGEKCIKDVLN